MGDAGDEDVIELEPLGDVDRHHLDGVLIGRLDRCPVLFVELLDGIDVIEERAEGELALHGFEGVDLVEEGGEVPPGAERARPIQVGVELVEDPDPTDHLAEELPDRFARLLPQDAQLIAERGEPGPRLLGQALDLVEPLERFGEQEGLGLDVVLGHVLEHQLRFPRREPGDEREVLEPDPVPRTEQDPGERHRGLRVVDRARVREDLDHLGLLQEPGEADDLDRHVVLVERALQETEQA